MSLLELKLSEQNNILEEEIQNFLLDIQKNFWENGGKIKKENENIANLELNKLIETENKKYLQIQLKEKFWIKNIRKDWINRIYKKVIKYDTWDIVFLIIDEIHKLKRRSDRLEKVEKKI